MKKQRSLLDFVWEVLFILFVLFPLLTGGVWYRSPSVKLEWTDLSALVPLFCLFTLLLHQKTNFNLYENPLFVFCKKLGTRWSNHLHKKPKSSLFLGIIFFGSLWSIESLFRHKNLQSHAYDLGIFTNALNNLNAGMGYRSSLKNGLNLFTDHQSPLFLLFAPFYKLYPHPSTLLILQNFLLASGAMAFTFYLKQVWKGKNKELIALSPFLYWFASPIRSAARFEFHPEIIFLPIALTGLVFLFNSVKKKQMLGLLLLIISLGSKESAPITLLGLSFSLFWLHPFKRSKGFSIVLGIISISVFLFDLKGVPLLLKHDYSYQNHYKHLGNSLTQIIFSPLFKPVSFLKEFFNLPFLKFFIFVLIPLGGLSLRKKEFLPVIFFPLIILALDEGNHRLNSYYHYGIEPFFGAIAAFPFAILIFRKRFSEKNLVLFLLFTSLTGIGRSDFFWIRSFAQPHPKQPWISERLIPCLNTKRTMSASGALVPHLDSLWIQTLPLISVHPDWSSLDNAECILIDSELNNWPMQPSDWVTLEKKIKEIRYEKIYSCGSLNLFQHPKTEGNCLSCVPSCKYE